jgi:hypothetical protein
MLLATVGPAFAHDCVVANKPVGAGSVGTVAFDSNTGQPVLVSSDKPNPGTISQPHGAFATLELAPGVTVDTFAHPPEKAQAPFAEPGVIPGALNQEAKGKGCDGKGLDTIDSCLGG